MRTKQRVMLAIAAMSMTLTSYASANPLDNQLFQADQRIAAWRDQQMKMNGTGPRLYVNGALVPAELRSEVIGDGLNSLSGEVRFPCLDTSKITTISTWKRQPESSVSIIRNDYDLDKFFKSTTAAHADADIGQVSVDANTQFTIANQFHLTTNDLVIVAHYAYVAGTVQFNGTIALDPTYDLLRQQDPMYFIGRCGDGFLYAADEGLGLDVMYQLHKKHEIDASDFELTATLALAYGWQAHVAAKEDLTDRQKAILDSYDMTSQCYAQGGDQSTCQLLHDSDGHGVWDVWTRLTAGYDDSKAVVIHGQYMTFAQALGDQNLDIIRSRGTYLDDWVQAASRVDIICNTAPYIDNCQNIRDAVAGEISEISEPNRNQQLYDTTDAQSPLNAYNVVHDAYIGQLTLWADIGGGGASLDIEFSADPTVQNAYRPGIIYNLKDRNFANVVSSAGGTFQAPAHWSVTLFQNEDGSGDQWTIGHTNGAPENVPQRHGCGLLDVFRCNGFNDEAKAFRLNFIP